MAGLFRHDGWPTLLLAGLFVLAFHLFYSAESKNSLRRVGFVLIISAILSASISPALVKLTGAVEAPKWLATSAFLADLQYLKLQAPQSLSGSDKKILDEISGENSRSASLGCISVNGVIFANDFHREVAQKYWFKVAVMWIKYMRGPSAEVLVRAHLCRTGVFVPPPFAIPKGALYTLSQDSEQPNYPQLMHRNVIPGLHAVATIWSFIWEYNDEFVAWPGLHVLLVLFLCFCLYRSPRHRGFIMPLVAVTISRTVTLIVFGVAADFRYAYSIAIFSFSILGIFAFEKVSEARFAHRKMRLNSN